MISRKFSEMKILNNRLSSNILEDSLHNAINRVIFAIGNKEIGNMQLPTPKNNII
jgi:hypothetical protein